MVDLAAARRLAALEQTRRTAAEYLADQEDLFGDAVRAAFRAVFAPVLDRFAAGLTASSDAPARVAALIEHAAFGVDDTTTADHHDLVHRRLVAAGYASPDDLNTIRADWLAEVEHTLAPMVSAMFDTGALSALIGHRAAVDARNADETLDLLDEVLNRNASAYLETATNRLVGIGDTAWADARETLLDGFTLGESVPDLAQRVQDSLGVAETRAVTIARTEVVGASNAGSYAGVTALGTYGPARKVWLATVDSRTREAHMDADGQAVALDEPFIVDGEELEYPGDPAGSAGNVINCRCTLIYEESEDPPTDLDAPGRGQGGTDPDPLTDEELADLAASGQENPDMARTRTAVRTRSGFAVPPPPSTDDVGAPAEPTPAPVAEAPAPDAPTEDVTIEVPDGVMVRPFEVVLAVEGRWTGDDRFVLPGAIRWDGMLPIPVDANHDETVEQTIGLIGEVFRVPGPNPGENLIIGRGLFDLGRAERPHEAAQFAVDRIELGTVRQASMSVDDETLGGVDPDTLEPGDDEWWMMVVEDCRLRAVTLCTVGAFAECGFTLDPEGVDVTALPPAPDGPVAVTRAEADAIQEAQEEELEELLEEVGMPVIIADGSGYRLVAAAPSPNAPPASWFDDPGLDGPTPLTIDDDGRVYGHIATWGTCHTGFRGECITPPHSATGYAAFRTGEVVTREGTRVAVGRLTAGAGHANKNLAAGPAAAHYDNTATAYADVAAGEDAWGLWVAGAVRPTATPEQVAIARSSPPSGDWRRIGTSMELVAALHVNSPGFPVARARIASGVPQTLIAAGMVTERRRTTPPEVDAAAERIARTIGRDRESLVAAMVERVHPTEEA